MITARGTGSSTGFLPLIGADVLGIGFPQQRTAVRCRARDAVDSSGGRAGQVRSLTGAGVSRGQPIR